MPDDNRFAGLSAGLDEDEGAETESADVDAAGRPAADSGTVSPDTTVSEVDAAAADEGDETEDAEEGGPAFGFDETTAKSIYVREETLAVLEDTEFEVEMHLRRDHKIRDVTGREFHDAAVRVLEGHAEEVVDAILAARDGDADADVDVE